MFDEVRMHGLGVLDEQSFEDRDADAAADVTHQAEQGGGLGQDRARQGRKADRAQRHEHKAQPETLDQPRDDNRLHIHAQREPAHLIERESGQRESTKDNQTDVDEVDDPADQEHSDHRTDAARRDDKTGRSYGVMHQLLQHCRQQCQRREHDDPDKEHQHKAVNEIGVAQQIAIEERTPARRQRVNDEEVQGESGDRRLDPDLGRVEPILEFAPVEQNLQGADRNAKRAKAEKIKALAQGVAGLVDEHEDADEGNDANWQVNVEHPAPVVIVGQPAAERGTDDRADHDAGTPYRHGLAVTLGQIDAQEDGLRQRHQRRATDPLQQAEEDDLGEVFGKAAQHRRRGKADDRNQKDAFDAEGAGQP